jgi:hypothetical protein
VWFEYEIVVQNDDYTVFLTNTETVDGDLGSAAGPPRGSSCWSKFCLSGETRLAILARMTKTEANAIEDAYKENLGKMFNAMFDAYIQGQGPTSDVARKAANERLVNGLKILRDTRESITKLVGP